MTACGYATSGGVQSSLPAASPSGGLVVIPQEFPVGPHDGLSTISHLR